MEQKFQREFDHNGKTYKYYSLEALNDPRIHQIPYSIRILLEHSIRSHYDGQIETLLNWGNASKQEIEIFFKPNRVLQQDFTGLPTVVEMATMRNAISEMGGDAKKVNPACPVHMIIDHSIDVDYHGTPDARQKNEDLEFSRYKERFAFFKWIEKYFKNFITFPPTSGIAHQINLEYLATVLTEKDSLLYPDTCLGTDSHTPLINSIGVFGWGIGGIEAVSVMMGEEITMKVPEVVGFKFEGRLGEQVSAMDLALILTEILRKNKVVGKFVEFYGPGVATLSVADRVTICSMAPEYGATMGYFPPDQQTLEYLLQTNRSKEHVSLISKYMAIQHLTPSSSSPPPKYSSDLFLDLSSLLPTMAGPKRPHDCVLLSNIKKDFYNCIEAPKGFKGFGLSENGKQLKFDLKIDGQDVTLKNGSILLCSITACTNTGNHSGILAAGLLAKRAVEKGLQVRKGIKTSFSPGTGANTKYLEKAGLNVFLDALGFHNVGYGCMTCLGNSGDLNEEIDEILTKTELVGVAVTSADRNFEGRVHPLIKAHYLGSPGLVVAWAIAGRIDFNLEEERLGVDKEGKDVFLRDIWPSRQEVEELAKKVVCPEIYEENYKNILNFNKKWNDLEIYENEVFNWPESNYICKAPYFQGMTKDLPKIGDIQNARILAILGDSIPTDQISPAGKIAAKSPAGIYLSEHGVAANDFNSYGSRRAHAEVMSRGAFGSSKLCNQLLSSPGPFTIHHPTKQTLPIFEAACLYKKTNTPTVIIAGKDYGCGSSRDSAAKGPMILGVKAIIAEGFERIHRANLIGVGVMAIEVKERLDVKGEEEITIKLNGDLRINHEVEIIYGEGKTYKGVLKIETESELEHFKNGGLLNYVLRKIIKN